MKLLWTSFLITVLMLNVMPVEAKSKVRTDERTGLQYNFTETTVVKSSNHFGFLSDDYESPDAKTFSGGENNIVFDDEVNDNYTETLDGWLDSTNKKIELARQRFQERLAEYATYVHTDRTDTATCYLQDGNICTVVKGKTAYWRFFNLSPNFKGTKTVVKQGITFVVTGDGEGTLSFRVDTDMAGVKTQTFVIPPTFEYIGYTPTKTDIYRFSYVNKDGQKAVGKTQTVDQFFDWYEDDVDPKKVIDIQAIRTYEVDFYIVGSYSLNFTVVYGNSDENDATTYPMTPHPSSNTTTRRTTHPTWTNPPFTTTTRASNITTSFDKATGTLTVAGTGEVRELYPRYNEDDKWPKKLTGVVEENTTVKHLIIKEGITSISNSFHDLNCLKTVSFPNSLKRMDTSFIDCDSLTQVDLPDMLVLECCGFNDCDKLAKVKFNGKVYIDNEYTGGTFFSNLPALEELYFPDGSSVNSVCHNCPNLKMVEFGEDAYFYPYYFLDAEGSMLDSFVDCHKQLVVYVQSVSRYENGYGHIRIMKKGETSTYVESNSQHENDDVHSQPEEKDEAPAYVRWLYVGAGLLIVSVLTCGCFILFKKCQKTTRE